MKKVLFLVALIGFLNTMVYGHNVDLSTVKLHDWKVNNSTTIKASLLMIKGDMVYLEKANSEVVHFPLQTFSTIDQEYIKSRYNRIQELNSGRVLSNTDAVSQSIDCQKYILVLIALLVVSSLGYYHIPKTRIKFVNYFLATGVLAILYSFEKAPLMKTTSVTNPSSIDSAFIPFKPNVATSWDNNYFYVESQGIPTTHGMMVGISNHGWQQQVPIPQCYLLPGNAWSVPLNPTMATSPIPVDSVHFTRGAIAIAVNGVPIFNPHTNTGVDAYLDGQLDNYGGHCGRADDYHYHTAPLHLYGTTNAKLPIAYAFDGFAVYGSVEPDGSAMTTLDANHGHYGTNGVYHYHGTATAPYMIAKMAGQVTEDTTHQLIPQAAAHPVRPGLTPLSGALITSCVPNGTNGYIVTYTLSGQTYQVSYSWTTTGVYTFNFINPSGTTTSTYNGFVPCHLPTEVKQFIIGGTDGQIELYPNPASGEFSIRLGGSLSTNDIKRISIVSSNGQIIYTADNYNGLVKIDNLSKGLYFVEVRTNKSSFVKKLIID